MAAVQEMEDEVVKRFGSVIELDPAGIDEYERLHAAVWPELLQRLDECNLRNYTIFRYGTTLFSYVEYVGDDYANDMERLGADPVVQRWWSVCEPLQRPVPERAPGEWWHQIPEVFHHG